MNIRTVRLIMNGPLFTILYGIYTYALFTLISNLFDGMGNNLILPLTLIIAGVNLIALVVQVFYPNIITHWLALISEIWKGTSIYMIFFTILIYIVGVILALIQIAIPQLLIATLLFVIVPLIAIYALYNADKIRIKNVELEFDNLDKPINFIHISDLHIGAIRKNRLLKSIVKNVNKIYDDNKDENNNNDNKDENNNDNKDENNNDNKDENNIDFLVITGDLADGSSPIYLDSFEILAKSKVPIYFTLGNHDFYPGIVNVVKAAENANIHVLCNDVVDIKGTQLIGIPFGSFGFDNKIIRKNAFNHDKSTDKYNTGFDFDEIDESKTSILLNHVPVSWDLFKELGVDLVLSGHTHGGQFFPFNFVVKRLFPYIRGLYEDNGKYLYVSDGIGTLSPPMRLGTNAEMCVFHLKSK